MFHFVIVPILKSTPSLIVAVMETEQGVDVRALLEELLKLNYGLFGQ